MQSQGSINVLSRWEPMPAEFLVDGVLPKKSDVPVVLPGLLCFSRSLVFADEDERDDRMMRTCINFPYADTANLRRSRDLMKEVADENRYANLDDAYSLAGVSLTGESTGNPMMALTHVRFGQVAFRNTGIGRIEAGDDVYFVWPGTGDYRTSSSNVPADLRVAETIGTDDFRRALDTQIAAWVTQNTARLTANGIRQDLHGNFENQVPLDRLVPGYVANHFVGRCLLGAESGGMGALMIG